MKKALKGYLLGFLSAAVLVSGVTYAANNTKSIEVIYDNVKVYKDNVLCELKDANGTVIEPFIYNGTTYMPVRGTANLAGMDVTWDGVSKSVYLWDEIIPDNTYLMEVCPPYQTTTHNGVYACNVFSAAQANSFLMGGKKYTNGLTLAGGGSSETYALFNLNGKYKSLEMVIAPVDGNEDPSGIAFLVDGKNVAEYVVKEGDYPKTISVPLNYGLQLKIVTIDGEGRYETGLGNIIVK